MKHFVWLFGFALLLPAAEPLRIDTLDGPWKGHAGDDLRWAAPDFDDSAWPRIVPPLPEPGIAWYRRTVQIPAELKAPVALWFPALPRQAEVYVNGRLALQHGIPGQWITQRWGPSTMIDLPNAPGTMIVIAWRVQDRKNGLWDAWGPPLLGSKAALKDGYDRNRFRLFRMTFAWLLLGLLNLLFAVAALALWRMQPGSDRLPLVRTCRSSRKPRGALPTSPPIVMKCRVCGLCR